jgi:hypothetical protein
MSNEHFTVTVRGREYHVVLTPKGEAISVTNRVKKYGSWCTHEHMGYGYSLLASPVRAAIKAAQARRSGTRDDMQQYGTPGEDH